MKENDTIYYRDHRGVIRSISVNEYVTNSGSRAVVNERLGVVTRRQAPDVSRIPADGGKEQTPAKNSGEPVCEAGGESPAEIHDQKAVYP